ncbi:MAG: hypothetical protein HY336_01405 [Candidatus Doudnabacteria bacterium]|nr:hypothetical protein [Candidatus Doudnabacteria bacterium]
MPFKLNKIEIQGQLSDPKVYDSVLFFADLVLDENSGANIHKFHQDLKHALQQQKNQLGENASRYDSLLLRLQFRSIPLLSDEEIKGILSKRIFFAYKADVDLKKSFSMMFVPFFFQDDFTTLTRIIRHLEDNSETIGRNNIILTDGKVVHPLISNWLKDYRIKTVENKGSLNIISFLTHSNNCKNLNEQELGFLKYVLNFYDWLRFEASKTSFIEEDIPAKSIIRPVPPPAPSIIQPPQLPKFPVKFNQEIAVSPKPVHLVPFKVDLKEIEREVGTPELPAPKTQIFRGQSPTVPHPAAVFDPRTRMHQDFGGQGKVAAQQINVIDDLKKLDVGYLRRGELQKQISNIKYQISKLAQVNHLYPYQVVMAFEQSPLFKLYLSHGSSRVIGQPTKDDLSQPEFEAIADLRKEIERL